MPIGDSFRLRNWNHYFPIKKGEAGMQSISFTVPDKSMVAVFVFMGYEKKDGTGEEVDFKAALNLMGYVPKDGL